MAITPAQDQLFATPGLPLEEVKNPTVFTGNMGSPVHRWFRYPAGFSAAWASSAVTRATEKQQTVRVLDPFAGSGTTLLAAQLAGADSVGWEPHPFVFRVAQAKLAWSTSPARFVARAREVEATATPLEWHNPPPLMAKVYPSETLAELRGLWSATEEARQDDETDRLLWLAVMGVLRACSPVGTAQWQYVLPNKTKARVAQPKAAYRAQVALMAEDMAALSNTTPSAARVLPEDARTAESMDNWATHVITSPPYPNNYDYADATRIEMTFLEEVRRWGDLQSAVRTNLIRSCSQHMVRYSAEDALKGSELDPIRGELEPVFRALDEQRQWKGGKKAYHAMTVAYFSDLAQVWARLRTACVEGCEVSFIVGDSAPYGVHIPVERWLGELALATGFESWTFEKFRDRNLKWKNRKHRVPLHEGLLKVSG
jgi:hypothetical protein